MIREEDLREAIAECEGSRSPTAGTCLKLAAYYAILDRKLQKHEETPVKETPRYSFSASPEIQFGNSDFCRIIQEKGISSCFPVIDEAMGAMEVVLPKLYKATMRKLEEI